VDPPPAPLPPAVNEVTDAVTSLPLGETSHHFAPKLSLPCPLAVPEPESPA
jgi:hypothetical protein